MSAFFLCGLKIFKQGDSPERTTMEKNKVKNISDPSTYPAELHPSEQKLIEAIRAIKQGEIETVKIQNGLPVIFKITLGEGRFCEEDIPAEPTDG